MSTLRDQVSGSGPAASVFDPTCFTLANGLEVVVVENHRAPVVAHWLWYRVGTADSPLGKSGLPHFLEHLMFKGTKSIPPGEFSKIVAKNGGNDNAQTSNDYTAYFQMIAKDRLGLVMEMEADRMVNLQLADEVVYPERDVIAEERKQRVDNDPSSLLQEQLMAAQFLHHPYRLPVIGWAHEIDAYTREDAEAFYRDWYAPNNAILIVSGDVTADEIRPLAEATYGKIAARDLPQRRRMVEPPQNAARRITLSDKKVVQPTLQRSYLAPSRRTGPSERVHALEVLAALFGSGGTSRLYKKLVVEKGLAAQAGSWYRGWSLDDTAFRLFMMPRPGVSLDALEDALDAEIGELVRDGVSDEDLVRVKRRMIAEAIFARDSLNGAVYSFGAALTTGGTIADVEAWPQRIDAVTREEVEAAARDLFDIRRSVTGRLLPEGAAA